jgi:ABC-type antimicrobial peptide transport system permease subunit
MFAGTLIAVMVLTGALIIGESVTYSLEQLVENRLGNTHYVISSGNRYFSSGLGKKIQYHSGKQIVTLLKLNGFVSCDEKHTRLNQVEITGIDSSFASVWKLPISIPEGDGAIVSRSVAEKLKISVGDHILVKVRKPDFALPDAPFVSVSEDVISISLQIAAIASDHAAGYFNLKNNQSAPYNIFVSYKTLSRETHLTGKSNVLLVSDLSKIEQPINYLSTLIQNNWELPDAGLSVTTLQPSGITEITHEHIFIDSALSSFLVNYLPQAQPVFTYLFNSIRSSKSNTPYSFVSGLDSAYSGIKIPENEIVINSWLADDLQVSTGDSLWLRFYKMETGRKLREDSICLKIKTVIPVTTLWADSALMPDFPGMESAGNCRDWETGAPVDLSKIRDKDEDYWKKYRGTPKAFVSLETARHLWQNTYGNATAIRLQNAVDIKETLDKLPARLNPAKAGITVKDAYTEGMLAATNSTDFGQLFLGLGFFIIAAAIMLIVILLVFHLQQRNPEPALLSALGFSKKQIKSLIFTEISFVIVAGSIAGAFAGIVYTKLMLAGLHNFWNDAVRTNMLQVHTTAFSLWTGMVAGSFLALLAVYFSLSKNLRQPQAIALKANQNQFENPIHSNKKWWLYLALMVAGLALGWVSLSVIYSSKSSSLIAMVSGAMMIAACSALVNYLLIRPKPLHSHAFQSIFNIALNNLRARKRNVLVLITLLATGTFAVIITGANRLTFYGEEYKRQSGTGGFILWVESTLPIVENPNTQEAREHYGLSDYNVFNHTQFTALPSLDGNDASCFNLNQVNQPRLAGVNNLLFDSLNAFAFQTIAPSLNEKHPWLYLSQPLADHLIPGFADQTVITWGIRGKIGDTLEYKSENGDTLRVVLSGGLQNSVFQGHVLIASQWFKKYYPSSVSPTKFLVSDNPLMRDTIANALEYLFQDFGLTATPASRRLADFNSVTNAYLAMFMLLAGLGVIIGVVGLGIVLMRNIASRKAEIAAYQALGFSRKLTLRIVLIENVLILFLGLTSGIIAAFTGLIPSLFLPYFDVPVTYVSAIVAAITASGLVWVYKSSRKALSINPAAALRSE